MLNVGWRYKKESIMWHFLSSIVHFYRDGFRELSLGKTLWKILFLKLAIMFFLFKLLFFSETLQTAFTDDNQRSTFVLDHLIKEKK